MSVLNEELTTQLKSYLELLENPIEIVATLDDSPKSAELSTLLDEITALSEDITVRRADDNDRSPSFAITRPGTDISVRFAGIPLGHEFTSLVLALLQVSGRPPKVDDATLDRIRALDASHHFETYMSLSCQNCPDVVQALNLISIVNPKISHVAIEGGTFQSEIDDRNILAVPTVYRDGELFGSGRMDLNQIIDMIADDGGSGAAAALNDKEPYDVLIVGSGPAGAAAAVYAARKGIRVGLAGGRFGGQVLDTMSIENYIATSHTEGPKLAADLERHVRDYEVDVMTGQLASDLTPATSPGGLHTVTFTNGGKLTSRAVIVATGAEWRAMNVPGEQEYRNKGVTFCPHCDGPLFKEKKVAVIGGGNSGIEAAIDLAGIVEHVTVFEFMPELRADEVLQRAAKSAANIDIVMNAATQEVLGDGTSVTGLRYEDRETGEKHSVELSGVFVQIGLVPVTKWIGDAVDVSDRGEVVIGADGSTSTPGIFAAGDCTITPYKQIIAATGDGAKAALGAFDYLIRTPVSA